jgi:hypothetical protein
MSSPATLIHSLKGSIRRELCCDDNTLVDEDPGSRSGQTKLTAIHNGVVVRLAPPPGVALNHWLFPLLAPAQPGLSKICDHMIFLPRDRDDRLVVLLCELKSTNCGGALKQLRGGLLLAEYLINTILLNHPPTNRPGLIEYRGLIFSAAASTPRGSSKPAAAGDFVLDEQTDLPILAARSGREHHINSFCAVLPEERVRRHHPYKQRPPHPLSL